MIRVYGSSDDLIEIEGDIRAEFCIDSGDDDDHFVAFADGTLLRVYYDNRGICHFTVAALGEYTKATITPYLNELVNDYSDVITLDIEKTPKSWWWVAYAKQAELKKCK
jgi:hypothetical protein